MNTARKLILVATALPLFAIPALTLADEAAAMDACFNAFVSANLPKEQKATLKTLDSSRNLVATQERSYAIELKAKGIESGKRLASATCVVERNGTVIALNGKPVAPGITTAAKATLTSR